MSELPSGTVTFLFTDIEGSTRLWQEQPEAMAISHARHDEILRDAIESNHGYVFQIVGDSFSAAFHNAIDGLRAVLVAQRGLGRNTRPHRIAYWHRRNIARWQIRRLRHHRIHTTSDVCRAWWANAAHANHVRVIAECFAR